MYVETWIHFGQMLQNIKPALTAYDKDTCNFVLTWSKSQGNKYTGITEKEKSEVSEWLRSIRPQFTGKSFEDIVACQLFIMDLNKTFMADHFKTINGCTDHGYYWYQDRCHTVPQEITPVIPTPRPVVPPSPEPIPKPIPDIIPTPRPPTPPEPPPIEENMLAYYVDALTEYLKTLPGTKIIERTIVKTLRNWLSLISAFMVWDKNRRG